MDAKPHVVPLVHTPDPEQIVSAASRLCTSSATIPELLTSVSQKDQASFIARLLAMGHLSPFEHVSFTFGIKGVSRAMLAQITRHRIASFSVQSQRYVAMDGFDCVVPPSILALGGAYAKAYRDQMKQMDEWYRGWLDTLGNRAPMKNEAAKPMTSKAVPEKGNAAAVPTNSNAAMVQAMSRTPTSTAEAMLVRSEAAVPTISTATEILSTSGTPEIQTTQITDTPFVGDPVCPECRTPLDHEGGCTICKVCGYSKCG